jgi:anaerobic selenocysteine-containing dehydrogenase
MPSVQHSVCALDCPDTCAVLVNVDEHGHGSKLRGDPSHPVTRGFLCGKVAQYLERVYHPDRLLYPMRRVGPKGEGRFARISWEEALDEIASKLTLISREFGTESILPYSYAGTMGLLNGSGMDRRFFHRLGASRLDRTICSAAGGAALMLSQGIKLGTEPEQFVHSKLIIAWGANILGTNVHLWPFIVEARRRGARLVVIDPVKNRTGRLADCHLAINPGSDLALALGLAHIILREGWQDSDYVESHTSGFRDFSELVSGYAPDRVATMTGLPIAAIEDLAREYAMTRPAVIRVNYGVQRTDRGGSAVRAIATLPVLTGSWKEVGGGLQLTTSGAFEFDRASLERPDLQTKSALGRMARVINMSELGRELLERKAPPVQALVVYNSNPAAVAPNQGAVVKGLKRSDLFTVVLDQFVTDTAAYADIVLPVTTFLEHTDLYLAYGHYYLQLARPALPAPGEAKSNVEIFRLLAKRMGFDDPCFDDTEDQMIDQLLASGSPYLKGITRQRLDKERSVRLNVAEMDSPFQPFAAGGFRTHSEKFEFGAAQLAYTPPAESRHGDTQLRRRFPLELVSSKNDDSMNSTFGHRESVTRQTEFVEIHAADALDRGINDGDQVRLFNDRGALQMLARISDAVKPGVLRVPSGRWNKKSADGLGVNILTSDRLTDIGGGATFFSCLVEAVRAD